MCAYIVAIQAGCPTPSTPPTPSACKHLIFNGHLRWFWVQAGILPYTHACTLCANLGAGQAGHIGDGVVGVEGVGQSV